MSYEQFQIRDPSKTHPPIDADRAKVLLNCFDPTALTPAGLKKFVSSLRIATVGNLAVLGLLSKGSWREFANNRACIRLPSIWISRDDTQSVPEDIATLNTFCSEQANPLPLSMVHAIFDEASF
jgi:hypothetical protein